jgi:hypothetical protein
VAKKQQVEALTELLKDVIHALEMTQYEIDDAHESHYVVQQADQFHQQMLNIIHSENK